MGCSCYLKAAKGVAELDLTFNVGLTILNVKELNVFVFFKPSAEINAQWCLYSGTCPVLPNDTQHVRL